MSGTVQESFDRAWREGIQRISELIVLKPFLFHKQTIYFLLEMIKK